LLHGSSAYRRAVLDPDYPIHTERLLLRPLTLADADDVHAYQSEPEVCRYIPYQPRTHAEVIAFIERNRAVLEDEGQVLTVGVELPGTGIIGDFVLFWRSREHQTGEIGWVLSPSYSGRGYATEAARALLGLAFSDLKLHRVIARVDTRNDASARMCRRLGMRQEGHLVDNEWFKGEWTSEFDFAILDREWEALQHG
jgi:RimJ/RimL family protein N-acetyltransferase